MYHISDIKKYLRCERFYFYSKGETSVFNPYLRSDENIDDLLKLYLKIDNCFLGLRNDPSSRFFENENDFEWFMHPRFVDEDLRINIPIMHKTAKGYVLYFMLYACQIKELDTLTYRICLDMLKKQNITISKIKVIYFNNDYVRKGNLDVDQLFKCVEYYNQQKIISLVKDKPFDYNDIINKMQTIKIEKTKAKKSRNCFQKGTCPYYDICFDNYTEQPDDSVLTLVSSKYKYEMFDRGISKLKDIDINLIEGNRVQYAQIMASKNNGLFIDKYALGEWLTPLNQRPISFIDFEWDRYLIPKYNDMHPMDVVCFEFALYYIDEKGSMEHRCFIGTGDCRKEFVEALIDYLPKNGPVLAYNAYGAECLRLKELAHIYPEYQKELLDIENRFVDLATPFVEGIIYDVSMKGDYSLKRLVDICSNYSYKDLDIYNGMDAVFNWRNIDKGLCNDEESIRKNLDEYCSLDAYGLFLVYKWLVKLMLSLNKKEV